MIHRSCWEKIKRNWGFFYFSLFSLVSLVLLLRQDFSGHYRIFTSAGRALWGGLNPHGTDFGTGVGYWFYSPTCGLLFFGPFTLLPETFGLLFYMVLSWAMFVVGVGSFLKLFFENERFDPVPRPEVNWLWFFFTSQVHSAVVAAKIELFMVGLLFLSFVWLYQGKRLAWSAFFLAMLFNWKGQVLPTLGLFSVVLMTSKTHLKWFVYFLGASLFWWAVPLMVFGVDKSFEIYQSLFTTMQAFLERDWLLFDHLYRFLSVGFGISLSVFQGNILALLVGMGLAVGTYFLVRRSTPFEGGRSNYQSGLLAALAFGAFFTVCFSPLSQNNASVLVCPLIAYLFVHLWEAKSLDRSWLKAAVIVSWLWIAISYSDLYPYPVRSVFKHFAFKPLGVLVLALFLGFRFSSVYKRLIIKEK